MRKFIGRKKELAAIEQLRRKSSSSLMVLRGRRRIGKSRLLKEYGKQNDLVFFSGIPPSKKTTAQSQRNEFMRQMSEQFSVPRLFYDDWGDIFWQLGQLINEKKIAVVMDEISWIGSKDPSFLGKLKNAWDLHFSPNPKLLMVLCGSISSWIDKNILSSTGFLGRVSLSMMLEELPIKDAVKFWGRKLKNQSSSEVFKILSVCGGVPKYLEEILPELPADENIRRLCFVKEGLLYREFDQIFSDLFDKKHENYKKVVLSLSNGPKSLDGICEFLKVRKSSYISQMLGDLIQAGFVRKDPTWNIKTGATSNLVKFRISDNYIRFYLRYIFPNISKIEAGLFEKKKLSSLPEWSTIMGYQFENLVLSNKFQICEILGISPSEISSIGPFFQKKTLRTRGCQVDLLIQAKQILYVCEVKFSQNRISKPILEEMSEKIERISIPFGYSIHPVLIHTGVVDLDVEEGDFFDKIIDFSDLYLNHLGDE